MLLYSLCNVGKPPPKSKVYNHTGPLKHGYHRRPLVRIFFPSVKVQNNNVDEKMSPCIVKEVNSKWVKWQFWASYPFNYLSV